MVRFVEVKKYFWRTEAINYFVAYNYYWIKIQISVRG